LKKLLFVLFLISVPLLSQAYEFAGYISIQHISGNTYQVTATDYSFGDPENSGRCDKFDSDTLRIYYGDNTSGILYRSNGNIYPPNTYPGGDSLCPCLKANIYIGQHTFSGPGAYTIWFFGGGYINGIVNMINSGAMAMIISNTLYVNPAAGNFSMPVITNPPVCTYGCLGQCYSFNLGATASTGDSVAYALGFDSLPGYFIPHGVTVDSITGELNWCSPSRVGLYNFSIVFTTYVGTTHKILVDKEEVQLNVTIDSSCTMGINELTATGGYMMYPNPAESIIYINGTSENDKQITVYNMVGQLMFSAEENQKQFTLNTSSLNDGIYFVTIKEIETGSAYTLKLVKN